MVQNAGDAIEDKGFIRVITEWKYTKRGKKNIILIVEDSGKGIDPELDKDIFKPFFTTKEKGLGMGLALVQQAVESHQGSIKFEQNSFGTRFIIHLPLMS